MKELLADWKMLVAVVGGGAAAIAMLVYAFARPASDPDGEERKRRLHLNHVGRIAEGQVVELAQHAAPAIEAKRGLLGAKARPLADSRPRHLVSYSYSISGVTYADSAGHYWTRKSGTFRAARCRIPRQREV